METTLRDSILSSVQANIHIMDKAAPELTDPLWTIFGEAVIAIHNCSKPILDADDEDDHVLLLMCCNALSDSFAAFLSTRQGFLRPPAIVMRGVVENVAAVVTFLEDEDAMKRFKEDRYDLPKAIGPAKKHFPELGIQYGVLTNKFTHETYEIVGRSLGGDKGIFFIPRLHDERPGLTQGVLLTAIAMIVHTIGQVVEFCFIRHLSDPTFWEREGAGQIKMKTTAGRKLISVLGNHLESMLSKGDKSSD